MLISRIDSSSTWFTWRFKEPALQIIGIYKTTMLPCTSGHTKKVKREREKEGKETVQGAKQKPHHIPTDSWQPAPPKNKSEMTIFRRDY
jgi:hypothetical protein